MKILSLDQATHTGWAHSCGASGVWDCSVRRDESSGMRLIRLRSKLDEILKSVGIDLVVFEANRNLRHGAAVRVAGQIQGLVEVWCTDNGIEYRGYSASQIKKHATGKGNANKDAMIAAAALRWPEVKILDDNHADALWLLDLAQREFVSA